LTAECRRFLAEVEVGRIAVRVDSLVVHEITYALPRVVRRLTRTDVATILVNVLSWPGIEGDSELLRQAVLRWHRTPGLGFVDAYLCERAAREAVLVYTKNVAEFTAQGIPVPNPLPPGT
jgi:hypothetical protein